MVKDREIEDKTSLFEKKLRQKLERGYDYNLQRTH